MLAAASALLALTLLPDALAGMPAVTASQHVRAGWFKALRWAGLLSGLLSGLLPLAMLAWREDSWARVRSWPATWRPVWWFFLGQLLPLLAATWAFDQLSYGDVTLTQHVHLSVMLLWWGLWAAFQLLRPGAEALSRWQRRLAWAAAVVALLETGGTFFDYYVFSPYFLYRTEAQRYFATFREMLHGQFMGYPFNSLGYYDKEFHPDAGPEHCTIAWIADSFGMGVVPYPYNITTVAETRLRERLADRCPRLDILNFGVPNMDLRGYALVAEFETPPMRPDLTVLSLFVGNDLFVADPMVYGHSYLQNWRLVNLLRRQLVGYSPARPFYRLPPPPGFSIPSSIDAMTGPPPAQPDYIDDPDKEQPRIPEVDYWRKQRERLSWAQPDNPNTGKHFRQVFQALTYIRARTASPLVLVVAPDEYQVDGAVWNELMKDRDPAAYDRDLPQRRLRAWCEANGLPMLDLLPVLRQAQVREGHVYHPRDTHWNVRGNRVAGEAAAAWLEAIVLSRN